MHNGDLDKMRLQAMHTDKSRFLEPVGKNRFGTGVLLSAGQGYGNRGT